MFAEWVATGAAFGIEAFFAVAVFLGFCAAIAGLLGLAASIIKGAEDGETKHRPY